MTELIEAGLIDKILGKMHLLLFRRGLQFVSVSRIRVDRCDQSFYTPAQWNFSQI